ncbi:Uncharacterised protein [Mycobacteroides abscessus]|nr:Uncharacterised protein [Mycobacteroides abscessus]
MDDNVGALMSRVKQKPNIDRHGYITLPAKQM